VLRAINNLIEYVERADLCLVYDRPLPDKPASAEIKKFPPQRARSVYLTLRDVGTLSTEGEKSRLGGSRRETPSLLGSGGCA
jgi:hypothetical protein